MDSLNQGDQESRLASSSGYRLSDINTRIYIAAFVFLGILTAASPVLRTYFGWDNYNRVFDAVTICLLLVRLAEFGKWPLPEKGALWIAIIVSLYILYIWFNSNNSHTFNWKLALLDLKILLFSVTIWAFSNRFIVNRKTSSRFIRLIWRMIILGVLLYLIFPGGYDRLKLVDESNYMMVIIVIVSSALIGSCGLSKKEKYATMIVVVGCAILSESRTAYITIFIIALVWMVTNKEYIKIITMIYVLIIVALSREGGGLLFLSRGEVSLGDIDRLLFVKEYIYWLKDQNWIGVLFGNHTGDYLSDNPRYMSYWVAKQSDEHGIPFGLAAFNFHAAYLRLPANIGIVPALGIIALLLLLLRRSVDWVTFLVIFLAGFSMSIFYLSTTLPFIILAQLTRPESKRVSSMGSRSG